MTLTTKNPPPKDNPLGFNDVISFGKYKNYRMKVIAEIDPGYIVWLHEETSTLIAGDLLYFAYDNMPNTDRDEHFANS